MMHSGSTTRFGRLAVCAAVSALALSACAKKTESADTTTTTTNTEVAAAPTAPVTSNAADAPATAPAAGAPAAGKGPAASDTTTLSGVKYASYTGDPVKGKVDFVTCQTCHTIQAGVNRIGPSLHAVVGRQAGQIPGFTYSPANKNSGITWTEEKLFQYLEGPQRVVPGTKMTFVGWPNDPQKRADVIAYLKTNG